MSTRAITPAQRLLQVIEDVKRLRLTADGEPLEAVLCHGLHHMGVTQTYGWAMHPSQGHNGEQHLHCWMLMQYLDRGSLVVSCLHVAHALSSCQLLGEQAVVMSLLVVAWAVGQEPEPSWQQSCSVPLWQGSHGDLIHAMACINMAMLGRCLSWVPDPAHGISVATLISGSP